MLIAHYIGNHTKDSVVARLGASLTRLVQKGPYGTVTHTEAIHAVHGNGSVTIASASLRDGGVRSKQILLNSTHWIITNVVQWDLQASIDLLKATNGKPYDWRGALATVLPGSQDKSAWFCNEWVGSPYLKASGTFGPHQFCAVCMSLGTDVTDQFFRNQRERHQ